jgi:uncharacterized protein YbjT (DUF2867 family)
MRILVLGGTGFIGAALVAHLTADGYECVTVSRDSPRGDGRRHIRLDIASATRPADWDAALDGVGVVVNAAGAMQDGAGQSPAGVHVKGIAALYTACEMRGVRRVIHISAIGVDQAAPSAFSRTKRQGEAVLMARDLDWVILRPSVVIGRAAYGGSALLRGLAALPVLPVLPNTAPIQPVRLDDVIETIVYFIQPRAPLKQQLDLAGPRRMSFDNAVRMFRNWLRWPRAGSLQVPRFLSSLLFKSGDLAYALGWRTPVTTTAEAEMRRGAVGDPVPWQTITGMKPRDVEAFLQSEPASVQERWFAKIYALKPLIFGVFGIFWIATGLISLGPGFEYGMALLREGGLPERFGTLTLVAGALADIVIGCAILYRPLTRYGLWAALIISLTYAVIGTVLVPRLWADPLGPMLKIWPVLVLNLVAMAIREDR